MVLIEEALANYSKQLVEFALSRAFVSRLSDGVFQVSSPVTTYTYMSSRVGSRMSMMMNPKTYVSRDKTRIDV